MLGSVAAIPFHRLGPVNARTEESFIWAVQTGGELGPNAGRVVQVQALTPLAKEGAAPAPRRCPLHPRGIERQSADCLLHRQRAPHPASDYSEILTGSVVIPAGSYYVDQTITPVNNATATGDSDVMIMLAGNA